MRQSRTPLLRALQDAFRNSLAGETDDAPARTAEPRPQQTLGRRRFVADALKAGAFATVAAGALGRADAHAQTARRQSPAIAIVGAGLAGLNAAHRLRRAGLRADLYEAADSPGGRVHTVRGVLGEGLTTEAGAEFIDTNHTEMLRLVREFRLPLYDTLSPSERRLARDDFFVGGRRRTEREVVEEFRHYAPAIKRDADALPEDGNYAASQRAQALDRQSVEEYLAALGVGGWFFDLLDAAFTSEYGLDIGEQSALNFVITIGTDTSRGQFDIFGESDERFKVRGGNDLVTRALARSLEGQIKTGRRLHAIAEGEGGRFRLDFGNGGEARADFVILAVPFTTLRQADVRVALPPEKRRAIQEIGYGTNSKLVLGLNDRPWRARGFSGYLLNETIQNGWDNSQMQRDNRGPGGYTVFLGGEAGLNLHEERRGEYLSALDAAYPGARSQFNGRARVFNWPSNPNTLGSYACYKTGQWTALAPFVAAPVGRLHFAGEHCSSEFQGFMNGAAETGRAAAESVLRQLAGARGRRRA